MDEIMHLETGWCHQVGVDGSREQGREFLKKGKRGKLICGFLISPLSKLYVQDVPGSGVHSCVSQHFLFWIQEIFAPCQTQQGLPSAGTGLL